MGEELVVLAQARWQVLRNSLRLRRKRFELAANVAVALIGAVIALTVGTGLGVAAYFSLITGRAGRLSLLVWYVFSLWQLGPVVVEGASPALNFREIARYPISFRLYCLLHTAYGLLDPAALLCLSWLGCIWVGVTLARPGWADRAFLLFVVFAAVNLVFNRVCIGLVERVMSTRRGRERLMLAALTVAFLSQVFIYVIVARVPKQRLAAAVRQVGVVHRVSPPGLAIRGITGDLGVEAALLGLAAYGAAAALVLRWQLWRNYRGEPLSETPVVRGAVQVQPGWKLPWLDDSASAIVEKELRYALRDPRTLIGFFTAPVMAVIAALSTEVVRKIFAEGLRLSSAPLYPLILGYALLSLGTLSYNSFCYESRGFQFWQMSPVALRRVVVVKNAVLGSLLLINYFVVTLLFQVGPGLTLAQALTTGAAFVYAALAILGGGNLLSVRYPMRVEYGTMSTKKASSVAILFSLGAQVTILASVWLVFYLTARFYLDRLPLAAFAVLTLASLRFYLFSLAYASEYASVRGEEIAAELA